MGESGSESVPAVALREAGSRPFPDRPVGEPNEAMPFDHIVVVMMENHSFDNLLGALPLTQPQADGLTFDAGGKATNSNPGTGSLPAEVRSFRLPSTAQASDVTQTWKASHAQINGGAMDGFVRGAGATQPMGYYTSETLPFAYSLASAFTVGDRWFCSLPGPTYPNRRFLLAGTAYGCTVTDGETLLDSPPAAGTVFDLLSTHGISCRNYFSDLPMTMVIPSTIIDHPDKHLPVSDFFAHCRNGTLPAVSFVDPRIGVLSRIGQPIAALPPLFRHLLSRVGADLASSDSAQTEEDPQDMYYGEAWAHSIVQAVIESPCWARTLLIYIYDEHGGYYDHVPPPPAVAPDEIPPKLEPTDPPGGYDRYGPRVPAVVVSPYATPGGVTHVLHDHTSVLATIEAKWNLPALTMRDANANTVMDFLDLDQVPILTPRPIVAPSPSGPSGPVDAIPTLQPASPTITMTTISAVQTPTSPTAAQPTATQPPPSKLTLGDMQMTFWIAVIGIVAVLLAYGGALVAFSGSKNPGEVIPAVLGAVTAAIGTLAGLVAGHAAGAAGKAQSDQTARDNVHDATAGRLLAKSLMPPEVVADGASKSRVAAAGGTPEAADVVRQHAALAKTLFPDVD